MASTATQVFSFMAPSAEALPRLACIGYVESVGQGKTTAKGVYDMQVINLAPTESGRKVRVNFLYQPSWLEQGFNPETLREEENGNSLLAVYRMHILSKNGISTLQGLAGSDENFATLSYALLTAEDKSPEGIQAVFQSFFNDATPEIGYILKQRETKTDDMDENGRQIRILENGYEIGGFFYADSEGRNRIAKQAAQGRLVTTFEV